MEKQSTFVSALRLATWTIFLIAINVVLQLTATGISLYTTFILNGFFFPSGISNVIFYSLMGLAVTLLDILIFILLVIVYLLWIHRAYNNILAFGTIGLKYTPTKSVTGFLIPFVNLTRPPAVIEELWKASDPDADSSTWKAAPSTPLVRIWWFLCLSSVLLIVPAIFYLRPPSINLILGTVLTIAANICFTLAAVLTIVLVQTIEQRQEKKQQNMID
ncbi:MAG: DUF4328 domain-containing protein [Bacillota bacterium]